MPFICLSCTNSKSSKINRSKILLVRSASQGDRSELERERSGSIYVKLEWKSPFESLILTDVALIAIRTTRKSVLNKHVGKAGVEVCTRGGAMDATVLKF